MAQIPRRAGAAPSSALDQARLAALAMCTQKVLTRSVRQRRAAASESCRRSTLEPERESKHETRLHAEILASLETRRAGEVRAAGDRPPVARRRPRRGRQRLRTERGVVRGSCGRAAPPQSTRV